MENNVDDASQCLFDDFQNSKDVTNKITEDELLKVIQEQVQNGTNVNARYDEGNTALHFAIANGYERIVRFLLESEDIEIHVENDQWETAWTLAQTADDQIKNLILNHHKLHLNFVLSKSKPNTRETIDEAHIQHLVSKSVNAQQKPNFRKNVARYYRELDAIPEVSVVLKVVQCYAKLKLIYMFEEVDLTDECEDGTWKICIEAWVGEKKTKGSIARELTRLAMHIVYSNEYNRPYRQNDLELQVRYQKVVENVRQAQLTDNDIIRNVFETYSDDEIELELIITVNQMFGTYGETVGSELLLEQSPELLEYYRDEVVPACEAFLLKEGESSSGELREEEVQGTKQDRQKRLKDEVRELNEDSGVVNYLQQINIQLKRPTAQPHNWRQITCLQTDDVLMSTIRAFTDVKHGDDNFLVLKFDQYLTKSVEIHSLLKEEACETLILACEKDPDKVQFKKSLQLLSEIVENGSDKKVIIILKNSSETWKSTAKMSKTSELNLNVEIDSAFSSNELSTDSINMLLGREITLQGRKLLLSSLIDENTFRLSVIDSETLSKLIRGNTISLGKPIREKQEPCYMHRTLCLKDEHMLRETVTGDRRNTYTEVDLVTYKKELKLIWVCGPTGTGKTTLLTHVTRLINEKFPHLWVVRFNLGDFVGDLEVKTTSDDKELEFLPRIMEKSDELRLETKFEKIMFEHLYKNFDDRVVLMFDGLDELEEAEQSVLLDELKIVKDFKVKQIWISSRASLKKIVDSKLCQFSFSLTPFSVNDQVGFLSARWTPKLNVDVVDANRVKSYAEALIELLTKSIGDHERNIVGVPLQCHLASESFEADFVKFYQSRVGSPKLPGRVDLVDLYQTYLETKYRASRSGTGPTVDKEREIILKNNRMASLFSEDELKLLLAPAEDKDEKTTRKISRSSTYKYDAGAIEALENDVPRFWHPTLAEYLSAKYLVDRIVRKPSKELVKFVTETVFHKEAFTMIRAFIDVHLSKVNLTQTVLSDVAETLRIQLQPKSSILEKIGFSTPVVFREGSVTLLHRAALEGNANIASLTLKCLKLCGLAKDLIQCKDGVHLQAVHMAALTGNLNVMKTLKENGADVDVAVNFKGDIFNGFTPLLFAGYKNHLNVCQWLINNGVDASRTIGSSNSNFRGYALLHVAALFGMLDVVKMLRELNTVDMNAETERNPLYPDQPTNVQAVHIAARRGRWSVVNWFIEENIVDVNEKDGNGLTVLLLAAEQKATEEVEWLILHKADVNVAGNKNKNTALHIAACLNQTKLVELLLQNKAEINAVNEDKQTPLHLASIWGHKNTVQLLIKSDVNAVDKNGYTPLHWAADLSYSDTVECLLQIKEVVIDIKNNKGCTPMDLAVLKKHQQIVNLIKNFNKNQQSVV